MSLILGQLIIEIDGNVKEPHSIIKAILGSHPHIQKWKFHGHKWVRTEEHVLGWRQWVFLPITGDLPAWENSLRPKKFLTLLESDPEVMKAVDDIVKGTPVDPPPGDYGVPDWLKGHPLLKDDVIKVIKPVDGSVSYSVGAPDPDAPTIKVKSPVWTQPSCDYKLYLN